jgi:esterase
MLLEFQEFGKGRPVIILHGLFGSGRNWQGIARGLAENYHVITPDLRNHGQSPHTDSMSYSEMADDVIAIADKLNLTEIIIVGHSMGGKVAMTAALSRPERFSAMVVVDIAPVNYEHEFNQYIEAMLSLNLQTLKSRSQAETELGKVIDNINIIQLLLQNLIRAGDNFEWRINLEGIMANLDTIGQFPDTFKNSVCRLPTLFLGGSESEYLRSIYNSRIFQYFPAAEITMINGTGHWPHAEKPNDFLKQLKSFINYV